MKATQIGRMNIGSYTYELVPPAPRFATLDQTTRIQLVQSSYIDRTSMNIQTGPVGHEFLVHDRMFVHDFKHTIECATNSDWRQGHPLRALKFLDGLYQHVVAVPLIVVTTTTTMLCTFLLKNSKGQMDRREMRDPVGGTAGFAPANRWRRRRQSGSQTTSSLLLQTQI